ncbi:MAG: hypothetical protein J6U26_05695 [Lachnospiraceae bacterium]|nr:hypothetical protein [Lachnospiraceae bacterium]
MKRFGKAGMALFLAVALLAAAFSSCGGSETKAPKRTHDQNTYVLSNKDAKTPHNFVDGKCTLCDETSIFVQDPVGGTAILTEECDQKGTVEEIWYDTRAYFIEETYKAQNPPELNVRKRAFVYLPYGYDKDDTTTKYNVLYLLHGSGLNEGYWFKMGTYAHNDGVYTKGFGTLNMLDKLMKSGEAEKTIIVTPCLYPSDSTSPNYQADKAAMLPDHPEYEVINNSIELTQFYGYELKNDLMPYIAEHYNTYAASGSPEDLIAARDHQGYAGLSLGSMTSYGSIINYCLDYISYIGSYSGGPISISSESLINKVKSEYSQYKINFWYVTAGSGEGGEEGINTFLTFRDGLGLQDGSDIKAGDNCAYMLVNGTAHNYATWITALYNSMRVFFKK